MTFRGPRQDSALLWGALAFTMRFTRFFGTAPLRFKRERNCWRVKMSRAMCVYSYVFIAVLNMIVVAAVILDAKVPDHMSIRMYTDTTIAIWAVDLVIVTSISLYGILSGPSQMKQLIVYLNQLNMIFTKLKYEYIMQKPEKFRCSLIVLYLVSVVGLCAGDIAGFNNDAVTNNKSLTTCYMYTFYYIEVFMLCLLEMQFILAAMLSHTAFQCINEELTSLIKDIDLKKQPKTRVNFLDREFVSRNSTFGIPPYAVNVIIDSVTMMDNDSYPKSKYWSESIRRLSLAYSDICDAVRLIDKSNGVLVLLLVLSFLVHMVVTPYYLITFLIHKRMEFMIQVFWSAFHGSKMILIVEPGHRMQQEVINDYDQTSVTRAGQSTRTAPDHEYNARVSHRSPQPYLREENDPAPDTPPSIAKTQVLVGQLMNRVSSIDPMMEELNIFHKQINLNPVLFSPLGICTVGRPLIASILGAVTTYLVILVQFQKSESYFS